MMHDLDPLISNVADSLAALIHAMRETKRPRCFIRMVEAADDLVGSMQGMLRTHESYDHKPYSTTTHDKR